MKYRKNSHLKKTRGVERGWLSQYSITVTKYLRKSTYKEERLISTQNSRDFSPRLPGLVTWVSVTIQCIIAEVHIGNAAHQISSRNQGYIEKDQISIISLMGIISLTSPSYLSYFYFPHLLRFYNLP